jgi:type II secretory ATPase GspE/PulE/Tfp pilus assembly ATPase PilB-like protein
VEPQEATVEEVLSRGGSVSIIDLVEALVRQAYLVGASDIHIDPTDVALRVRMRVDGVLQEKFFLSRSIHSEIISRIKVLSWLRTDEHQAVQDGRFRLLSDGAMPIDVRVSIVPTYYGENAVLRLLIDTPEQHTLATLGFSEDDQQKILRAVRRPDGMVLATGPTGSGKTTTLYTLLKMLNTNEVSIVTIEDPVEYAISNVTQIQTQAKTGLTFATGLRSILRQDPNIIMVGEIRDKETAGIAVNAALTGHLLLSTLHTSNAAATLPRLLDMGVDSYLVASTVSLVIGQRLVRKICTECRSPYVLSSNEHESLQSVLQGAPDDSFFIGQGCVVCDGSGYRGRVGVHEVLVVDTSVRDALLARESAAHIHALAVKNGMTPMLQNGLHKARLGLTSVAELLRTMHE